MAGETPTRIAGDPTQLSGQKNLDGDSGMPVAEGEPTQNEGIDPAQIEGTNDSTKIEEEATEVTAEVNPPAEPTPPEVVEAQDESKKREIRACDVDLVLQWLITDSKAASVDESFLELFKKVMEEKGEGAPDSIDETRELVGHLEELFADFDQRIEELSFNQTEYKGIKGKQIEIKKAICLSVINGHLNAADIPKMVTGVRIDSKNDPAKKDQLATIGYDAVASWDQRTGEIIIYKEALVDDYKDKDGKGIKLDFRHLVNHEMSHAFTERYLVKNERLNALCNELMNEPALLDLQPQHVRNAIMSLENIDQKFLEVQAQNPDLTKEQYEEFRRSRVAAEIVTDYTAMFLKSDGSVEGFADNCLALTEKGKFDSAIGMKEHEMNTIFTAKNPEEKQAIIAKLRTDYPAFGKTLDLWTSFHGEIQKATSENKGKVYSHKELLAQKGSDWDEMDELGDFGGYYEPAESFGQQPSQSKGGGGESIWANIGGLIKAMAEEAPKIDETIGK